jgi:hypothetical protein
MISRHALIQINVKAVLRVYAVAAKAIPAICEDSSGVVHAGRGGGDRQCG